jgi:hypothetical protein
MTDDLNARRKAALQRVITDAALDLFAVGTAQDIGELARTKE